MSETGFLGIWRWAGARRSRAWGLVLPSLSLSDPRTVPLRAPDSAQAAAPTPALRPATGTGRWAIRGWGKGAGSFRVSDPTGLCPVSPCLWPVHIMDPGCLYYGVQPVGVPGAPDRREGRGVCQERAEHR